MKLDFEIKSSKQFSTFKTSLEEQIKMMPGLYFRSKTNKILIFQSYPRIVVQNHAISWKSKATVPESAAEKNHPRKKIFLGKIVSYSAHREMEINCR